MNSDDVLSMIRATEQVIEAEQQLDDLSNEAKIATLRSCVRTLATCQRDFYKGILGT